MQTRESSDVLRTWWRLVADFYLAIMDSRWGYNFFGRALPSAFFLAGFAGGLDRLPDWPASADPGSVLVFVQEALSRLIGLVLVFFFAIRKRLIGPHSSFIGAFVSLSATFYGAYAIFFNTLGLRPPQVDPDPALAGVGVGFSLAATALLVTSYLYLGRHIGIFPEVRGLVTTGPYRYLRHPIYVGYLVGSLGGLITQFSFQALVSYLGFYALVAWRAALEERALERVLGDEYLRYRDSTVGLLPKLSTHRRPATTP